MYDLSNLEMVTRLVAALILGGLIGFERELGRRAAGLRTHALTAEGAALFTMAGILIAGEFRSESDINPDPTRIASAIVAGIGFLAAGVIFAQQNRVRGLTTAAGLWVTAAIGLLCGAGYFFLAISATVATTIVLSILKSIERRWISTARSNESSQDGRD